MDQQPPVPPQDNKPITHNYKYISRYVSLSQKEDFEKLLEKIKQDIVNPNLRLFICYSVEKVDTKETIEEPTIIEERILGNY
jgi:hypothetical protein